MKLEKLISVQKRMFIESQTICFTQNELYSLQIVGFNNFISFMNKQDHPSKISSKSKSAVKFDKSPRFLPQKSYSPNKFYNVSPSFSKSGYSMGRGQRTKFQKTDSIEPTRYRVASAFEFKNNRTTQPSTFGINRQQYYKGREQKNQVGPGAYEVGSSFYKPNFYIGQRINQSKPPYNPPHYDVGSTALNRLSNHRNESLSYRMKTQYYPKSHLQSYDNKVPGPGAYTKMEPQINHKRNISTTTFGVQERLKSYKISNLGPGKYNIFSQFGQMD